MVNRVFSMLLRALQGFIYSIFRFAHAPLSCPHHTCIILRAKKVEISFKTKTRGAIQYRALRFMAKVNGKSKNTGRMAKVESGESFILPSIQAHRNILEISCYGVYDTRACSSSQKSYGSNKYWKERYEYHRSSLSETVMYRVKQLLGGRWA